MMMKRRNIVDVDEGGNSESELEEPEKISHQQSSTRLSNDEIRAILSNNPSEDDMVRCFESLRKSLSKTKNPPIDEVIHCGLLQALVQALSVEVGRSLFPFNNFQFSERACSI